MRCYILLRPPDKSYAYLLHVEPSNLLFLKTYNAVFYEIIIRTKNQKIELRTAKYVKGYGCLSFARFLSSKYGKKLPDTGAKTVLDALKAAPKKVVHKAAEGTGEVIGNKIADKIEKPKPVIDENLRHVEEIVILPQKREKILNELTQVL